jgi:cytochrome P450
MSFLDDLERLGEHVADDARERFKAAAALVEQHLIEHPQPVFKLLRTLRPILLTHGIAVVTRYPDVVEVLTHDEAFSVEPYRGKMARLAGDFILGTDDGPQYEHDVSILRLAAPRSDVPQLTGFMHDTAEELVAASGGSIDVADLAKRAPARLAGRWLGVTGPDEDTLIRWTLAMFEEIFVNVKDDPAIAAAADEAAAGLRPHLDELIQRRKADADGGGDVLGRLLAMQAVPGTAMTDEQIRTNLIGIVVGFIPTIATATSLAIDALLDRPEALASAARAAQANDLDGVRAHVWEGMRLAPQGPGLLRRAMRDFTVAEGTHRATTIPAGTVTFAATQSAMLDDDVVDDPDDFRTDRPPHHHLHFGTGMHACFGRFANAEQIPAIAAALLRRPGLARADGDAGRLVKAGPFPQSLRVTFDAA